MRNVIRVLRGKPVQLSPKFNPLNPGVDFPQLFNRGERPSLGACCGKVDG